MSELKRTPLYQRHQKLGARFTPFGGWDMPVQFSGVNDEHKAVREAAGLFDVSHMGELTVTGAEARKFLQFACSNDIEKLSPGKALYTMLLNERGGVVDDIIVYQLADEDYLLCVNAANTDKDFLWLKKLLQASDFNAELKNVSAEYAQIALQGPAARAILKRVLPVPGDASSVDQIEAFTIRPSKVFANGSSDVSTQSEISVLLACTGYTGEDGFEIFCAPEAAASVWETILDVGKEFGIKPVGLGARNTLRLEVCYPLHGHELRDDLCALFANVRWTVKLKKGNFVGRAALLEEQEKGLKKKLVGFEVLDPGIAREEHSIYDASGSEVGWVASGTKTPTVGKAVGLAFVDKEVSKLGTELFAEVRGRRLKILVREMPFYSREQ